MSFAKTLSRDEMKNVKAGRASQECHQCCWADDVLNDNFDNCSGPFRGESGDCAAGAIKIECGFYW